MIQFAQTPVIEAPMEFEHSPFCCPSCHADLQPQADRLICVNCRIPYPIQQGIPLFAAEQDDGIFKDYATDYDDHRASDLVSIHLNERRWQMLIDHIPPDGPILELGCGTGTFLEYGFQRNFTSALNPQRFYGIDLSPAMLFLARKRLPGSLTLTQADGATLPFRDNSFSLVFSQLLLHHIHSHLDVHLREMFRVLQPSGTLWVLDSNPRNPLWWFIMRQECEKDAKQIPLSLLLGHLDRMGARQIQFRYHGTMPQRIPHFLYPLMRGIEQIWERVPVLSTFSTHYLATCSKG